MAYGLSVKLSRDVMPIDEPLRAGTIRNHVCRRAHGHIEGVVPMQKPLAPCPGTILSTIVRPGGILDGPRHIVPPAGLPSAIVPVVPHTKINQRLTSRPYG